MNLRTVLEKARALIADEAHWIQQTFAQNGSGDDIDLFVDLDELGDDEGPVCFCALGAVLYTCRSRVGPTRHKAEAALDKAAERLFANEIASLRKSSVEHEDNASCCIVNDEMGHAAVMAMYDEAIRSC